MFTKLAAIVLQMISRWGKMHFITQTPIVQDSDPCG